MCEHQHQPICEEVCSEEIDLAEAGEFVVAAMSQKTKDDFLNLLIGQMLGDAGDNSTKEQFDEVIKAMPQVTFYKPDDGEVRRVLSCASAVFAMVCGVGNNDEAIVALTLATLNKKQWAGRIW